jgi:hypothetical protein
MSEIDLKKFTRGNANFLDAGHYRDAYRYGQYVVKFLKPTITKKYGPFTVEYDAKKYAKRKFGIQDLNEHELNNYRRLQKEMPEFDENFARVLEVRTVNGESASIGELVTSMDGKIALRLLDHGKIRDPLFWAHLHSIEQALLERKIPYLDASQHNVVVRVTEAGKIPVFVDHKRLGREMYPFQLDLFLPGGAQRKIRRKFARMREQFQMR